MKIKKIERKLVFGSLFSGIGGIDLGLERAGMKCIWQVEFDEFCLKVLKKHWPDVRRYKDVKKVNWKKVKKVNLLAGGFPCQPVSTVGKCKFLEDARWLWSYFFRAICTLRPKYVFVENVPGLLIHGLSIVLGDLASIGYCIEWESLQASAFGAPHRRDRVWIVAYFDGSRRSRGENYEADRCGGFINGDNPKILQRKNSQVFKEEGFIIKEGQGPSFRGVEIKPRMVRMVDGVSRRLDRSQNKKNKEIDACIKAFGNSVVPQVVEWLGRQILLHNCV